MSSEIGPFEVRGVKVGLGAAPPVYAPGGPVAFVSEAPSEADAALLADVARGAEKRGAVLLVVQCPVIDTRLEALLLDIGFAYASSWYFGPLRNLLASFSANGIRNANAADVPRILEIGERKREKYEAFSPVFWKKSPTPRDEFAPYVTMQVESNDNVAIVREIDGEISGYLIAQCRNLAEGYVDDYAVADQATDWPGSGVALLAEASRQAATRNVETFAIVTGHVDTPKRAAVESLGFELRKNWLVKALTPPV